jgi:hypothetical protein
MILVRNSKARRKRRGHSLFGLLLVAGLAMGVKAADLPSGGRIAAGQVSISSAGSAMTVRQSTDKAAIHWDSFSVGSGHKVDFV